MSQEIIYKRPLWFEPFLQQVKKELGYPLDIDKYGRLLKWANDQSWESDGTPMQLLYAVCRVLFLQNHEHEEQFRRLFLQYITDELWYEQTVLLKKTSQQPEQKIDIPPADNNEKDESDELTGEVSKVPEMMQEPPDEEALSSEKEHKRYLNLSIPPLIDESEMPTISSAGSRFLFSDAYLPLSKREMIHAWRHLRKREQYTTSNRLNVKATVLQIAKQGILLNPVFEKEQINSDNLLLILADRRGSMTPFHRLSDQLIDTAIKGGGHRKALVYYFYNCPVDVVYRQPNLTQPVPLNEIYSRMRANHTNALILSDAGSARGNLNPIRIKKTKDFLYGATEDDDASNGLHKNALFVVWVNPMPRHRWCNTTADEIANDEETPMYPLMENGYLNFLQVMNKLMGK